MTLPDITDKENTFEIRRLKNLSASLVSCLRQAVRRKGVISGVTACAEQLQSDCGKIMMCILPSDCGVAAHIHHTLIEAFCHENGIALLRVDSCKKLERLVNKLMKKQCPDSDQDCSADDGNCILIEFPKKDTSKQDKTLMDFYREMTWKHCPMPTFNLPG